MEIASHARHAIAPETPTAACTIAANDALRSLTNEAGRQSDYYHRRNMDSLTQMWSEIEALAFAAGRTHRALRIYLVPRSCSCDCLQCQRIDQAPDAVHCGSPLCLNSRGKSSESPIPIKGCEQGEKPRIPQVIKAFRQ